MERIKNIKKQILALSILGVIVVNLSGCTYVNNKSWDEMTETEKEEARQKFEIEREAIEEEFPDGSAEGKFASYILDKVEYAVNQE